MGDAARAFQADSPVGHWEISWIERRMKNGSSERILKISVRLGIYFRRVLVGFALLRMRDSGHD